MNNPYFNKNKENRLIPAINHFIEIDGEKYFEILDNHIEGVMSGQYINQNGIVYNTNSKRFIHPNQNINGYVQISIMMNNKTRYTTGVHRLLMLVYNFQYGCEKLVVNHKDGNKSNNSLDNLEWVTQTQNVEHAIKSGLLPIGENTSTSKLTNNQVKEICEELSKRRYLGQFTELANKYNVSNCTIESIAYGTYWKDISKDYNIDYNFRIFNSLNENNVKEICKELSKRRYNGQFTELANKYNVSTSAIKGIAYGSTWTEISKNYNIDQYCPKPFTDNDIHIICQILQEFGKLDKETYKEISNRLSIPIDYNHKQIIGRLYRRESHNKITSLYKW